MAVSFYKNTFDKDFLIVSPEEVAFGIAQGTWQGEIMYLRSLTNEAEYKAEKKKLPAVTWSGTFKPGSRSISSLVKYSNLTVLDIDNLSEEKILLYKSQLLNEPFVRYCFISPSGTGLKIVIEVSTFGAEHRSAFLHLKKYFEEKYFFKVDDSGKDVSRLCYVSYDPQIIINSKSEIFQVDTKYGQIISTYSPVNVEAEKLIHDHQKKYEVCVKWVERNKEYHDGNKNNYIHAIACALNRVGVPMEAAIMLIDQNLVTPDKIWYQSVRSAYFHNQGEHGKFPVKKMGITPFIAPPYIISYNDEAISELMTITSMLYHKGVPKNNIEDLICKLVNYYDSKGWIDTRKEGWDTFGMMAYAINELNKNIANVTAQHALAYIPAEEMARDLVKINLNLLPTHLLNFDEALGGGQVPGNAYGLIGFGGTYKSILIMYMAYMDAMAGIPSLYVNGEMSQLQFLERLTLLVLGINLRYEISTGNLREDNVESFMDKIKEATNGNLQVYSGSGFTKQNILSTLDNFTAKTGKKIGRVYIDGMAQMHWNGKNEVDALIDNSFILKDIAKEANNGEMCVIIALMHCSGEDNKVMRNTSKKIRGGQKVVTNLDGYMCTSLLIDPESIDENTPDDFSFISGKFYIRMVDKRSAAPEVNVIVNLNRHLHLSIENTDPRQYEINPKKTTR